MNEQPEPLPDKSHHRFQSDARQVALLFAPILIIALAGFFVAFRFVEPAPPKTITMAAGSPTGAYTAYTQRYKTFLAERGIELIVRETAGSLENLDLMRDSASGVSAGFVQGGTGGGATGILSSLASLFAEPLWIFYRGEETIRRLDQLAGMHIALGGEGSGTRSLALRLLADAGVASEPGWSDLSGDAAADALAAGTIDAAFFVIAADAPVIGRLAAIPGIKLVNLARARGLAQRHRFLTLVTLHRGALNLQLNVPATDILLPAPVANLVARNDLHPTLVSLLMQAAERVHGGGGPFHAAGTYPSAAYLEFPQREQAERYLKRGPPFLQRYLPFWLADLIDRAVVLLIPLLALAFPLFRIFPPFYAWRMKARVNKWYKQVELVEEAFHADPSDSMKQMAQARLREIDRSALKVDVPLNYAHMVYRLRQHIALVSDRLTAD